MGVKHTNKAFQLPLPSAEKFVLLALCRYANNEDDSCYPGIAKLSSMTSFCEKTVQRAIKVLSELEVIDISKGPKLNNIYTLYLRGDLESWTKYLNSKSSVFRSSAKRTKKLFSDSKSPYKEDKKEVDKEEAKASVGPGSKPPVTYGNPKQNPIQEEILPPGKKVGIEKLWLNEVFLNYDGLEAQLIPREKWELDHIHSQLKSDIPVTAFLKFVVKNWRTVIKESKGMGLYVKDPMAKNFPNVQCLAEHLSIFLSAYLKSLDG